MTLLRFQAIFPQIEYVLVDEFQDITNPRLETLFAIHNLFPDEISLLLVI